MITLGAIGGPVSSGGNQTVTKSLALTVGDVVIAYAQGAAGASQTATLDGVAMTVLATAGTLNFGTLRERAWIGVATSTATLSCTIDNGVAATFRAGAFALVGADPSVTTDTAGTHETVDSVGTTETVTQTPVAANAWMITIAYVLSGNPAAGTGSTVIGTPANSLGAFYNGPIVTPAATSMTYTMTSSKHAAIYVTIAPAGGAPIAFTAAPVTRDRVVVAAAVTLGAVPASSSPVTRDRVVVAADVSSVASHLLDAATVARDRFVAAGALARTEKIATLVEAFDGGSLPGTLSDGSTGDGAVSVAGGQLVLDVGTGTGYPYVSTVDSYSLNGSSVFWQLVTTDNALHYPGVYSFVGGTHGYYFAVDGNAGTLRAFRWADGVDTELASVTYDPAAHYQMRVRESGGTLYLETAPAGGTWSTLASEATNTNPAFIPTTVRLVFEAWYDGDAGALAEYESINVATGTALDAAPVPRDRVAVGSVGTLGALAPASAPVTRDRFVTPTSATLDTVATGSAPVARDRVVVAGALDADTGLDFDAATETRDRWSVAADGDAELVGAGGGILSRERWVLAAVAVVGALALDAAPVARDRHVAAGTVSTLAPHLLDAVPVTRDRGVLPAGGAAGTSLGGGAIATRDRFVVAATASTGSAAADLVSVTRDRVVVPALPTSGLTTGSAGVARDRYTVAADVVAVGGLAGASRPVARDRWVVAAEASSGVLAFDAVPVARDRFVLPVAAGEPQAAAGAPVTRDRYVVAASLAFVRRFPGMRGVVLLGVPQGLVVLGVPQGLVILDEEGNVGRYAMKRGDDDPPLDFQCTGTDGLPVAFVGDEALEVGVRRSGEPVFALLKPATFLDAALGKIRVVWDIGDSEFLAVGDMEFELQVLRTGARATTFPAEGYGVFPIWQDIVPDAES